MQILLREQLKSAGSSSELEDAILCGAYGHMCREGPQRIASRPTERLERALTYRHMPQILAFFVEAKVFIGPGRRVDFRLNREKLALADVEPT